MGIKKRKLQDLYITGREVPINDESGEDPVIVWIQKPNSIETESASRNANAVRSNILIALRNNDSDEYKNSYAEVLDMDRETLIEIAIQDDMSRSVQAIQAEIAEDEEWSKDDYLQGLKDSWFGDNKADKGLKAVYENADENDSKYADAKRVFSEIQRFEAACNKRIEGERERLLKDFANTPIESLHDTAVKHDLGLRGNAAWINEYRRSQLFFAVREQDDHKKHYFESRKEVDELHRKTMDTLYDHYDALNVEVSEGKDLPPIPDSSQPSEQSDVVETAASSGPVAVKA